MQTALSATMPTPHNSSTGPDKVVQYLLGINDDDVMALTLALFHSKPMHEYCLVSFSETAILVHKRRRNGTQFVYEDWQEFHLTLLTTNRRRRNMDSRSKTTWSPILIPSLSFSIGFSGELCFAWIPNCICEEVLFRGNLTDVTKYHYRWF